MSHSINPPKAAADYAHHHLGVGWDRKSLEVGFLAGSKWLAVEIEHLLHDVDLYSNRDDIPEVVLAEAIKRIRALLFTENKP